MCDKSHSHLEFTHPIIAKISPGAAKPETWSRIVFVCFFWRSPLRSAESLRILVRKSSRDFGDASVIDVRISPKFSDFRDTDFVILLHLK